MTIDIKNLRLLVQDCKLAGSPVFVRATDMNEILDRLEAAEKERDNYKFALSAYVGKTEWVQLGINDGTVSPKYLGWHRADAMADLLSGAEKDIALKESVIDSLGATLNAVANERDALLARIREMERQKPVAEWVENRFDCYPQLVWADDYKAVIETKLYALPGAKGEPK